MTHKLPFVFFAAVSLVGCANTATTTPAEKTTTSATNTANTCQPITQTEVAALFDRWNQSLQSGDPKKVVANYAEKSILLPTEPVSRRSASTIAASASPPATLRSPRWKTSPPTP